MSRVSVLAVACLLVASASAQEVAPPAPPAAPGVASGVAPLAAAPEATVETPKGSFTIRLLPEVAPRHVAHFLKTAKAGGFDRTTFHRLIAGGIIQGGDPLSKDAAKASLYGTGGLGLLKAEFSPRPMSRGAVAAVLLPGKPHSAGNQFFVVVTDQPALRGKYTIFGEVVSGMEVVDQISLAPVQGDKAKERIEMKVTVADPQAIAR